ncbi:uncharacterized mitochondrial protein-like protein [Tanacetum coccineum]
MEALDLNGTRITPCFANLNLAEPKNNNNVKIEISQELLMALRKNAYNGTKANDVVDYITRFLQILDLVKIPNVDPEQLRIIAFPLFLTGGARRWWMHEGNDKISTWVDLVDKFFYKYYPLSSASRINDTNGDGESYLRTKSTETSDGLAAIQAQLINLGREIKKVNEIMYASQVGCELCKGPHYTKDCPQKEEGKTLEEAYYTQFGAPYQLGRQYRAAGPGFYQ